MLAQQLLSCLWLCMQTADKHDEEICLAHYSRTKSTVFLNAVWAYCAQNMQVKAVKYHKEVDGIDHIYDIITVSSNF